MKVKIRLFTLLTTIILACSYSLVQAQGFGDPGGPPGLPGGDPGGPGGPGGDPGDTNVPIDGGLSLLVAAGIGVGVKKAYDKRKKEKEAAEAENDIL